MVFAFFAKTLRYKNCNAKNARNRKDRQEYMLA